MLEKQLQSKIITYLKKNRHFCFKIMYASINGVPDIFTIVNRKAVFIEVKNKNGKLSQLQKYQIRRINEQGIIAVTIYSYDEFLSFYNTLI